MLGLLRTLKSIATGRSAPKTPWDDFAQRLTRDDLVYDSEMGLERKKILFKKNITLVEFEPNSYCNRTCSFCPNSVIDRITNKTGFDRELYEQVIQDLASISYDKTIRFARYSEPLAFLKPLCEMISFARKALPQASIDIVSNGDYLKPQTLQALKEAGLSILRISIYPDGKDKEWTFEAAQKKMHQVGKRMGIEPQQITPLGSSASCTYPFDGFPIYAYSHDFDVVGFDRGKSMPELIDENFVRKSPCTLVYNNFTIDFNGAVMPCCNLRSDFNEHEKYVIETLKKDGASNIFDVYANKLYTDWRKSLTTVSEKEDPCRTCKQKAITDPAELARLSHQIDSRLSELGI